MWPVGGRQTAPVLEPRRRRFLLECGVNVNAQPPGTHVTATPLHTAASQGHNDVVR